MPNENAKPKKAQATAGKLKIGDDWNAIEIIALSQNNPLKAIAEFVENSIDARARNITIIRGKEKGDAYIRIIDDGEGIHDLKYVATHIGDSIKRKMKKTGTTGLQGEFGIGLLSFWIVGKELIITTSTSDEEKPRRMKLVKGHSGYSITHLNHLFSMNGTELLIKPILPGIRNLSGERIQNYLASELRDRISKNNVTILINDKTSRKQLTVEPRKFHGHLLHNLPEIRSPHGEIYCELYINEPSAENELGLYKLGTRVLPRITKLDQFTRHPWNSPYLEGIIDCSFLQLTPGTRDGVIQDERLDSFIQSLEPVSDFLEEALEEQKKAEEEKASRTILSKISKAFKSAFVYLADLDYAWLNIEKTKSSLKKGTGIPEEEGEATHPQISDEMAAIAEGIGAPIDRDDREESGQKQFFDFPGQLFKAAVSPAKTIISIENKKKLKAVCKDKKGTAIESHLDLSWAIEAGEGTLEGDGMYAEYTAGDTPGIACITLEASDGETVCTAECLITITAELIEKRETGPGKGLPGYTYQKAPGELWRSRYNPDGNIIIINNGHQDFIYASKVRMRQLRYIAKLFAKEMILFNFPGISPEESLERMSELLLYIEEKLS